MAQILLLAALLLAVVSVMARADGVELRAALVVKDGVVGVRVSLWR